MNNLTKLFSSLLCILLLTFPVLAQEGAADFGSSEELSYLPTEPQKDLVLEEVKPQAANLIQPKEAIARPSVQLEQSKKEIRQEKRRAKMKEKMDKFLNSKLGQWIIKRASIKAHKKQVRKELRSVKGDKEARKAIKERSQKEIVKIKAISNDVRIGIILAAAGIILTIIPVSILQIIGAILIVVGLVFIILGLI